MQKLSVLVTALAVSVAASVLSAQGTTKPQSSPAPTPSPAATPAPKGTIIQKVIVKVNGEIFTQSELEFRQIQALRDQQKAVQKGMDLSSDPALVAVLSAVTPDLLVNAVDELMLVQHAREVGIKIPDSAITRSLDDLKKANKIPSDAALLDALKGEGMTLADLKINIEHGLLMNEVQRRELMRNMTLTEEESRQYYNAHLDQFMKPATVTLREIVVAVPAQTVGGQVSFNVSADETAKQKITAVRERALKGEDFAKLVAEVSESGTKGNGGIIGPVNIADLSEALGEILGKMQQGEITEPLRTAAGYQIIKLDTRSTAVPEPFEKSREQISAKILDSRIDVERTKFLDKLRVQAVIEWKDEGYKKMYDTARAARKVEPAKGK